MSEMRLFDIAGNRLYLTADERDRFLAAAQRQPPDKRTFCETLAYSGCRVSEALELTPQRIELDSGSIIIRSLKKQREDVYRSIPVPAAFLDTLNIAHGLREAQKRPKSAKVRLWPWTRQHATTAIIKPVMVDADIPDGAHRTAKGLRHAFGVNAITKGVPLNMLKKWMGHSDSKRPA